MWFHVLNLLLFLVLEVMKVLKAKKHAKTRKPQAESVEKPPTVQPEKQSSASETEAGEESDSGKTYQVLYLMISTVQFLFFPFG